MTIDWDSPTGLTAICEGLQTRPLIAERGPVIGPSDDRFAYAAPYAVSARWNKRAQKFLGGLALHQCGVKRVVTLKSSVVVGSVELDPRALSWRSGRPNDRPTAKLRQLSSGRQVEYRVARGLSLSRVVHTANQLWIAVEDSDPDQPESAMQIIRVKAPWSAAT